MGHLLYFKAYLFVMIYFINSSHYKCKSIYVIWFLCITAAVQTHELLDMKNARNHTIPFALGAVTGLWQIAWQ